jgi:hypothetical protein
MEPFRRLLNYYGCKNLVIFPICTAFLTADRTPSTRAWFGIETDCSPDALGGG